MVKDFAGVEAMEMELAAEEVITNVQLPQRHQYQNLSRPNSLLGPEKEPIKFQINLVGAPPEVEQLIEHIKDVASQFLYHWKTFPISESHKFSSNYHLIDASSLRFTTSRLCNDLIRDDKCVDNRTG